MYKLLLTTALISTLAASPVAAGPAIGAAGFLFGGTGAVTSIFGFAAGTIGFTLVSAAIQFGISAILSRVALSLRGKPKQADIIRDLTQPTSLPAYRFVYGDTRAPGTPAPVRVKGAFIYACYILNSRPSAGPFTVLMDKRELEVTGDPFDFAGVGCSVTSGPMQGWCKYWIGRGDQTAPPAEILSQAGDIYTASDAWRGRTVIWFRIDAGPNSGRQERWPASPPEVMVDGRWSLVWDPRDPDQLPDDPSTWAWSANQALCTLDALRQNPVKPYGLRYIWQEIFAWAADVADEPVPVKAGGTIPRYEVNGVLVFSEGSEIEDQVQPLADAGASRFVRVDGALGILPATYSPPVMTLSDILADQTFAFQRYRPASELATEVSATYTSPDRAFEDAETPRYLIAGAQAEDGGVPSRMRADLRMVTDHRQAQRVAKIMGMRARQQRTISAVFPPEAFRGIAGATVQLELPAPYTGRNRVYEIESAHPGLDPVGQDGVALRVLLNLRETSPEVYFWDATLEEQDVATETFSPQPLGVQPPVAVTLVSDATTTLISGDTSVARVLFLIDPSPSVTVIVYEWQYKQGTGLWQAGGVIDRNILTGGGDVFGYVVPVVIGDNYTVRVRAVSAGDASEWVESTPLAASAGSFLAGPPAPISAVGGTGEIAVTFLSPNTPDYRAMEIFGASVDSSGAASLLFGPIYGAANATVTEIEDGLGAAATRYYFARSLDRNGQYSPFSASISATTA